jgi:hypothetical protein
MRISELLAVLSRMDPSLEVLAHAAHGECRFQFFDIESVALRGTLRSRDEAGLPQASFDEEQGRPLAVLKLTADF